VCREKFLVALMRALSLPAADPEDIQVRCLKAILGEKSKDPTMHDQVRLCCLPPFSFTTEPRLTLDVPSSVLSVDRDLG
jgi:hypothetical protein